MTDNSSSRLHDVFFYGLYMDPELLEQKGVKPRDPRPAYVDGFELNIGNKATLIRKPGAVAHGMVYSLTHAEIHALYGGAGLHEYAPEAITAYLGKDAIPVLSCNLIEPPGIGESNPEYEQKLRSVMQNLQIQCVF